MWSKIILRLCGCFSPAIMYNRTLLQKQDLTNNKGNVVKNNLRLRRCSLPANMYNRTLLQRQDLTLKIRFKHLKITMRKAAVQTRTVASFSPFPLKQPLPFCQK